MPLETSRNSDSSFRQLRSRFLETLNIEAPQGTIQGMPVHVSRVVIRFQRSRGLLIGPTKDTLIEMKQREFETLGTPTALLTGDKEILIESEWNSNGRVVLRQPYPLPMTILAIIPELQVGDGD